MIGIYKFTSPTNKVYIGQSVDVKRRFREHRTDPAPGKLKSSFSKHGFENHTFEILEECEISLLNERERHYQDFYDVLGPNGLNLKLTETNDKSGYLSLETRKKISEVQTGKTLSKEHKKKIGLKHLGKVFSKESREKVSLANKGRIMTVEQREVNSRSQTSKIMSQVSKDKISKALKGKSLSEETRQNMKSAWKKRKEDKLKKSQDESS